MNKSFKQYIRWHVLCIILALFSNTAYSYSCANIYAPWITTSLSGEYTVIRLIRDGVTNYELLKENEPSLKFKHAFGNLRFQKVLDDGTFVAMESGGCGGSEKSSKIHVIDNTGQLTYSAISSDLVEESYLGLVSSSNYYVGARMPWLSDVDVVGDANGNAKIVVRLFNYDKVEITVADGSSNYVAVPDLKDDAKGWSQRARWLGFIGERGKQLEHYSRALELAPDNSWVRSRLISHHRHKTDYETAQKLIEEALALEPLSESDIRELDSFGHGQKSNEVGHPISYQYELAELHEKQNNTSKAIELMADVLAFNPNQWSCNLFKAELELTDTNREEVRKSVDSVYNHHITYIKKSGEKKIEKDAVIGNFRESYASWLSKNGYHSEAEKLLLLISNEMNPDRSYYKFSKEQNFEKLAKNAKRKGDMKAELKYLIRAAEYSTTAYDLEKIAWRYIQGDGVEKNDKKALEWFYKALELPLGRGEFFPICYLKFSAGGTKAIRAAKPWCEKGVVANEGNSAFWLAMMLLNENRFKKKHVRAKDRGEIDKLLWRARDRNYPSYGRSDRRDFDIYELSADVAQNLSALESFAEQGSEVAAFHLGELYEHGVGTEKNKKRAAIWFEKAASNGDAEAEYHFGKLLLYSNTEKALQLLESSANGGEPWAAIELGELYYKGRLVEKNLEKMEYWLLFADKIMREENPSLYSRHKRETPAMRQLEKYRAL